MSTAFVFITGMTAAANIAAATVDFRRAPWVLDNMTKYGIPHSWLFPLGALKAAGAGGLLVGIAVPLIGAAAALGLILYFVGAVIAVARARWYSHIPFPAAFLLLAASSLALRLAER
jgi:hypothetical protein